MERAKIKNVVYYEDVILSLRERGFLIEDGIETFMKQLEYIIINITNKILEI